MIWRACERFRIRPPSVKSIWEENSFWIRSLMLAFDQIRSIEETEIAMAPIEALASAYAKVQR